MKSKFVFAVLVPFFLTSLCFSKNLSPQQQTLEQLSRELEGTFTNFLYDTIKYRLSYYYAGDFVSQEYQNQINKITDQAADDLQKLIDKYSNLLQEIEQYEGDDWDTKFEKTGVWKKIKSDIEKANVAQIEAKYWKILSDQKKDIPDVGNLLEQWKPLELGNVAFKRFLLGKIVSLQDSQKALQVYNSIDPGTMDDNLKAQLFLEISNINLKQQSPVPVKKLVEVLNSNAGSEYKVSAAFILNRYGIDGILEKTLKSIEQSRALASGICFDFLAANFKKANQTFSPFEVELTAQEMFNRGCMELDPNLLDQLLNSQKFSLPDFSYIAAVCKQDSQPAEAVKYYIDAADANRQSQFYDRKQSASQAAANAYQLFQADNSFAPLAIKAFECVKRVDPAAFDQRMHYIYGKVLKFTGDDQKFYDQMEKIFKGDDQYSIYARYEIALAKLEDINVVDNNLPQKFESELVNLIAESTRQGLHEVADSTAVLWGQFAVRKNDKDSAQKFANVTQKYQTQPKSLYLRARALMALDEIESAVELCAKAVQKDNDLKENFYNIYLVITSAARVIDNPQLQNSKNYKSFIDNIDTIGKACSRDKSDLVANVIIASWLETMAFSGRWDDQKEKLWQETSSGDQKETLSFMRCSARVAFAKNNFLEAADKWTDISKYHKKQADHSGSLNRWKAKYYQLLSLSNLPGEKESLKHHIEVLLKSNKDQQNYWITKINELFSQIKI